LSIHRRPETSGKLTPDDRARLERHAEHLIKAHIGVATTVRVVPAGALERSQGKAVRVVDKRPKA
jgi:phenylacetate-CoA ligase